MTGENKRDPADVAEEGELLAQWLDAEADHYRSGDERGEQNLSRAAAFIREAYPEPPPAQTVGDRLERMQDDLVELASALNRDGLVTDARRCQEAIVAMEDLRAKANWPDAANWPPIVKETREKETGERFTEWNCTP